MMREIALVLGLGSISMACQGTRPAGLGVRDGQLQECPDSPNCVFSQSSKPDHKIDPLPLKGSPQDSMKRLARIVQAMERSKIVEQKDDYLYVEFTSALMRFVDDVEFYIPEAKNAIQVRSASRIGRSDWGVNRKRVEAIRQDLEK